MVARVQLSGIGVLSNRDMRWPLSFRYDLILGTCGFR